MLKSLIATACLVASAAAHATWQEIWVNGVDFGDACVRMPQSNSPVTDVTSDDLTCNVSPSSSPNLCPVSTGDTVTVEMHQQPLDRSCANEAIGGSHYGPINIYLAKVDNALTADGSSASWFKINEMGLLSNNSDYWATEVLNDNCGHYTFTIPKDIAPGNYLLRAEVIALHVASSVGGAQFYMSCFQLSISGSGSASPSGVAIPGDYSATDPGILINIYTQLNNYTIPGPTVYESASPTVATTPYPTTATWNTASQPSTVPTAIPGAATSASSGSSGSSSSKTTSASSTSKTGSSSTSTSAGSTSTGTVAEYGQCGGIGYTGATTCASGYTCVELNSYYYQCQ